MSVGAVITLVVLVAIVVWVLDSFTARSILVGVLLLFVVLWLAGVIG